MFRKEIRIVNNLKCIRNKNNLTQYEFAYKFGVTRVCVSQWETGKRQPPISLIPKMARILGCSIEDIVMCFCDDDMVTPAEPAALHN